MRPDCRGRDGCPCGDPLEGGGSNKLGGRVPPRQGDTMKKLIAVPVVAVLAAGAAASAAGFAGGVSAAPVQSGDTWDLECARSAQVVEWGTNDHTATPYVDTALIKLSDSEC